MQNRYSSIHEATLDNNYQAVKSFLQRGIPVDAKNEREETPLMIATRYGYSHIVDLCLKKKANVTLTSSDTNTALHLACIDGKPSIVKQLIKAKADIEYKNQWGYNCLLNAAFNGLAETVQVLLEHNANIHVTNPHRSTPLLEATFAANSAETIEILILYGANINLADDKGLTPLTSAYKKFPSLSNVFMLLRYGAEIDTLMDFTSLLYFLKNRKKEWKNHSDDLSELFQLFVAMKCFCDQFRLRPVTEWAVKAEFFLKTFNDQQKNVEEFKKNVYENVPMDKNIVKISLEYLGFFHKKKLKSDPSLELKSIPTLR